MTDQDLQSLPIPVSDQGGLSVLFLFSTAVARPRQAVTIFPPRYLIRLSADTGDILELRQVAGGEFASKDLSPGERGTHAMPAGMTIEELAAKQDRLFELYDVLLPLFAVGNRQAPTVAGAAADEFRRLFEMLCEHPLRPYYAVAGRDFSAWIRLEEDTG